MSETVAYIGKASPLINNELTSEELAGMLLKKLNIKPDPKFYSNNLEQLEFDCEHLYFYYKPKDTIYLLSNKEVDPNEIIMAYDGNYGGSINYVLLYYSGGCGFQEALEEAFDKIFK